MWCTWAYIYWDVWKKSWLGLQINVRLQVISSIMVFNLNTIILLITWSVVFICSPGQLFFSTSRYMYIYVCHISCTTKELNNKGILHLNNIVWVAMWSLMMYHFSFNRFILPMLYGSTIKVCLCLVQFNAVSLHYK